MRSRQQTHTHRRERRVADAVLADSPHRVEGQTWALKQQQQRRQRVGPVREGNRLQLPLGAGPS